MLLSIFAELPTLAEKEFADYLLPFALQRSQHSDAHTRQSVCTILVRLHIEEAYKALLCLEKDPEASVRERTSYALRQIQ